ncbi:MAG: hypothetical protein R2744_01955 [Bacteroidales bacterium]
MGDPERTITASERLLQLPDLSEESRREAIYMGAMSNYELENYPEALSGFRKIAVEVTSREGAEAKYRVAELLFRDKKPDESER